MCLRARDFVLNIARDLAYLAALPGRLVARGAVTGRENHARDCLDRCMRAGLNSVEMLMLAESASAVYEGRRRAIHELHGELIPYLAAPVPGESIDAIRKRVDDAEARRLFDG